MTGQQNIEALPGAERAFGADDVGVDGLAPAGYVQEEYLLAGTAAGEPFRTRLLLRRPAEHERAGGVVVVEPMHFAGGRPVWDHAHAQLLRGGHTWIEVACQTTPAYRRMVASDPHRYARVRLAGTPSDRRPEIAPGADPRRASDAFAREWWATSPQLFGILGSVFALLRDGGVPDVRAEVVVLAGASQTGGVVRRYAALAAPGGPLAGTVGPDGLLALHSGGAALPDDLDLPTVELLAESDIESVRSAAGLPGQGRDLAHRDCRSPSYRCYEVPGMAHIGTRERAPAVPPPPGSRWSRFPHAHVVHAALEALVTWLRDGREPVPAPLLETDTRGLLVRDATGHARGGLRLPAVELPLARIAVISPGSEWLHGHEFASVAALRARYGDAAAYLAAARGHLHRLVGQGHYLAVDAERWLAETAAELADAPWSRPPLPTPAALDRRTR
ncbi:alpha/beta hydrolase domain-containing protein [Pseudonocardia sp. MH-G8]|uniref:alpha/beta hydrolase domain-containing protein n=1 Tax=Pseudonocardia sp. MH-G8 TaxID=1854588 RepID=UPI001179E0C6|nr:alpha/beta hydrolase domain-containing protein [Pseudonocardia sp. MH-G8]